VLDAGPGRLADISIVTTTTSVVAMAPVYLFLVYNQPTMRLFAKQIQQRSNTLNQRVIAVYLLQHVKEVQNSISYDLDHVLDTKQTMTRDTESVA
jgi:hypothetical protein